MHRSDKRILKKYREEKAMLLAYSLDKFIISVNKRSNSDYVSSCDEFDANLNLTKELN